MKESISGTALFMIVIFFVVIFTGYLCFSINKSRAFSVKNSIVRIVERYGSDIHTAEALQDTSQNPYEYRVALFKRDISTELGNVGYRTRGRCEDPWVAFNDDGSTSGSDTGVFCIQYVGSEDCPPGDKSCEHKHNPSQKLHYFKVRTFYHFDIPVFNNLISLTIEGTTKSMQ